MALVQRIVSGGQTGVDQAALDVALEAGLPCGGWCPQGRPSERGRIADRYPLTETPSPEPAQRTEWNVRDSDATLLIASGHLTGGTALTRDLALRLARPHLIVDPAAPADRTVEAIHRWLRDNNVGVLNVAGPRESHAPGIYDDAARLMRAVLAVPASG